MSELWHLRIHLEQGVSASWGLDNGVYTLHPTQNRISIAQGTGQGQRVGNRIRTKSSYIKGILFTQQQNANNKKEKFKTNTSGYKGVCWNKRSKKWQSCISVNKKTIYLGVFEDAELAHQVYLNAKKAYHHIT